jgi:hypothetical protein
VATTPSIDAPLPSLVLQPAGSQYKTSHSHTLAAHGSADFSGTADAFTLSVPATIWDGRTTTDEELVEAFNVFDADRSGSIDINELANVSSQLGKRLNSKQLKAAMTEIDTDQSGEVDLEEFRTWWHGVQAGQTSQAWGGLRKLTVTKRWGYRLADGLMAILAHHYKWTTVPAGSGAQRREFKTKTWSRRAQDRTIR